MIAVPTVPSNPSNRPKRPIVLAGPTGVGKSDLAVGLAIRLDGEIVGADAFQIYSGLGLLTAQPDAGTRSRIPHHLVGCIPPTESFDVARYLREARDAIGAVQSRGKTPIVAGGTGLYLRALFSGLDESPPPDPVLRKALAEMPLHDLVGRLQSIDPEGAATVDLRNPRRVQRAIEIVEGSGGQSLLALRTGRRKVSGDWGGFVLLRERDDLNRRIEANVQRMFAAGVIDEVARLGEIGPTAGLAIGWREIRRLLAGEMTREDCIGSIVRSTRQYAKRQMTWFRNQLDFPALNLSGEEGLSPAIEAIAGKSRNAEN